MVARKTTETKTTVKKSTGVKTPAKKVTKSQKLKKLHQKLGLKRNLIVQKNKQLIIRNLGLAY